MKIWVSYEKLRKKADLDETKEPKKEKKGKPEPNK